MRRVLSTLLVTFIVATMALFATSPAASAAAPPTVPTWWKVDTHEHSSFSGDARADPGVVAAKAKAQNYNAVFLTDHDRQASFQIQGANGNILTFSNTLSGRWTAKTSGSLSSSSATAVSTPVHSGSGSLHVQAASSSSGRSMLYGKRAPSLRAGVVTLDFWVLPQRIDAGSGVDVSVAIGGDANTGVSAYGYTNAGGTTTLAKSTTLVWQLGSARPSSQAGIVNVYSNTLSYTPAVWNHYVIDVKTGAIKWTPAGGSTSTSTGTGMNTLPQADQPADYVVLSQPTIEAVGHSGTADAYFDDYVLKDSNPQCPAADFVYRNGLLDSGVYNTSAFTMFPAREMGQNDHTNQFNFDITNPSQYYDTFADPSGTAETNVPAGYGDDGALCASTNDASAPWKFSNLGATNTPGVQASGYPAQTNHPGTTDTVADVTSTLAHGADAVEVRTGADYSATWDAILQQNHPIIGTYGSDSHEGVGTASPADYIDSPSLRLNDLMHSYFEGRMYLAPNNFTGRLVFNTDGSSRPYPARYPVQVSSSATSATVHLAISGGMASGSIIRWIYNSGSGDHTTDVPASGASYNADRTIPLSGSFTYARAEVRSSAGALIANTEPIFFRSVAGMPAGDSVHVESVTPTTGCGCSVAQTKGITSSSWGSGGLTLNLVNPAGSTVDLLGTAAALPSQVAVDGTPIFAESSLTAFYAATGDSWFYESANHRLYLRDKQSGTSSGIAVSFGSSQTDNPPSVPTDVAGVAAGSSQVNLTWTASTDSDATPVDGYRVYRDGILVKDVTSGTSFADAGLAASTTYSYRVSAYDTGGQESARSAAVSVTTTPAGGATSGTFTSVADAYVVTGDSVNHGTATTLRVDTSPATSSYLRFTLSGLGGSSVSSAKLKIFASSASSAGVSVHTAPSGWTEKGITGSNAPALGAAGVNSGPVTAGSYTTVDISSLVTGAPSGDVNLALVGLSSTALSMSSREGTSPPQLLITTGSGSDNPPTVPAGLTATAVSASQINLAWTASTDGDATPLAGYHVYRGGTQVGDVTSGTAFADTGRTASTAYSYTVSAYDTAGHESVKSAATSATTLAGGGGGTTGTFTSVADAYVVAGDAVNHGTTTTLKADTTPATSSYLRFTMSGLSGTVGSAKLKIYTSSALTAGFSVRTTAGGWTETGIVASNAPVYAGTGPNSGAVTAGTYVTVDVTSLIVSSSGDVNLALVGLSATNLSMNSREGVNPPQLVITTG